MISVAAIAGVATPFAPDPAPEGPPDTGPPVDLFPDPDLTHFVIV